MAFAQGSRSSLALIKETGFGTTPASPTFAYIPFNSHSLDLTKDRVEGNEILPDRMSRVDRHGNKQAGGSIEVDLSKDYYDGLIESAMLSTWQTSAGNPDFIKVGTTPSYYTIEDAAGDVDEFRLFTGMAVSVMSFSIAPNQMVSTTFELVGKGMTQSQATGSTGAAPTAIGEYSPMDSYSGTITDGGSGIAIVTGIDFSISNSFAPTFVVGSDETAQLEYGKAIVEGTLTVYYEDDTLIDKFLGETESAITVGVDNPAGDSLYTFKFPRVKYNGASAPVSNPQSRLITLPFVSIYDATEESNLIIERPESA